MKDYFKNKELIEMINKNDKNVVKYLLQSIKNKHNKKIFTSKEFINSKAADECFIALINSDRYIPKIFNSNIIERNVDKLTEKNLLALFKEEYAQFENLIRFTDIQPKILLNIFDNIKDNINDLLFSKENLKTLLTKYSEEEVGLYKNRIFRSYYLKGYFYDVPISNDLINLYIDKYNNRNNSLFIASKRYDEINFNCTNDYEIYKLLEHYNEFSLNIKNSILKNITKIFGYSDYLEYSDYELKKLILKKVKEIKIDIDNILKYCDNKKLPIKLEYFEDLFLEELIEPSNCIILMKNNIHLEKGNYQYIFKTILDNNFDFDIEFYGTYKNWFNVFQKLEKETQIKLLKAILVKNIYTQGTEFLGINKDMDEVIYDYIIEQYKNRILYYKDKDEIIKEIKEKGYVVDGNKVTGYFYKSDLKKDFSPSSNNYFTDNIDYTSLTFLNNTTTVDLDELVSMTIDIEDIVGVSPKDCNYLLVRPEAAK